MYVCTTSTRTFLLKVNPIQQMQSLKFHKYLPSKTTGIYNEYCISSFFNLWSYPENYVQKNLPAFLVVLMTHDAGKEEHITTNNNCQKRSWKKREKLSNNSTCRWTITSWNGKMLSNSTTFPCHQWLLKGFREKPPWFLL